MKILKTQTLANCDTEDVMESRASVSNFTSPPMVLVPSPYDTHSLSLSLSHTHTHTYFSKPVLTRYIVTHTHAHVFYETFTHQSIDATLWFNFLSLPLSPHAHILVHTPTLGSWCRTYSYRSSKTRTYSHARLLTISLRYFWDLLFLGAVIKVILRIS